MTKKERRLIELNKKIILANRITSIIFLAVVLFTFSVDVYLFIYWEKYALLLYTLILFIPLVILFLMQFIKYTKYNKKINIYNPLVLNALLCAVFVFLTAYLLMSIDIIVYLKVFKLMILLK